MQRPGTDDLQAALSPRPLQSSCMRQDALRPSLSDLAINAANASAEIPARLA